MLQLKDPDLLLKPKIKSNNTNHGANDGIGKGKPN